MLISGLLLPEKKRLFRWKTPDIISLAVAARQAAAGQAMTAQVVAAGAYLGRSDYQTWGLPGAGPRRESQWLTLSTSCTEGEKSALGCEAGVTQTQSQCARH